MSRANQLGKSRQKVLLSVCFMEGSAPYIRASENGYKFICMTKQNIPSINIHMQYPILFLSVPLTFLMKLPPPYNSYLAL